MKTVNPVQDGKISNKALGSFYRRVGEILRRVEEGTIKYDWAMTEIQRIIEGRKPNKPEGFAVWKWIDLGEQRSFKICTKTLEKAEIKINRWTVDILGKTTFSQELQDIELVRASVGELGFPKGASLKDIYTRAKEKGLDLCPEEAGPALRLAYKDQPVGEWLIIAMKPLTDSDGDLCIFRVGHDGDGLWLNARHGHPDYVWDDDEVFVFVRRK